MNRERMEEGIRLFLSGLAEDAPADLRSELADTPERVAEAWAGELLSGYDTDPASIVVAGPPSDPPGLVAVGGIRFVSVCAHHLLPFGGIAGIAFLPAGKIAGLGQLARLVDVLSRRLQIQERLTRAIADEVQRALAPRGLMVELDAEHYCLSARGARKPGHRLRTRETRGVLTDDEGLRAEARGLLAT